MGGVISFLGVMCRVKFSLWSRLGRRVGWVFLVLGLDGLLTILTYIVVVFLFTYNLVLVIIDVVMELSVRVFVFMNK